MSNLDGNFLGVLTGCDFFTPPNSVKTAIAKRAAEIISTFTEKNGDYCYDGNRCKPENLGWRFQQEIGFPDHQEILDGKWDKQIEYTWHYAAGSEHHYRYEKDWG